MTTRSIAAATVASLALTGVALGSGAGVVTAAAPDTPFEQLCTAFLAEYEPAPTEGASPECHDDSNVTQDRYGDAVNHTMFYAVCDAMGFDGIQQTYSGLRTQDEHWILSCKLDA